MSQPSFRDIELLSSYLDMQLSKADSARLEARLKTDPQLRSAYEDLRQARTLLGKLPARRAPRNFTLTPRMAGIKPPLPAVFPFFRLASVFALIALFVGYAIDLSVPATIGIHAAAPALAYGVGASGNAPAAQSIAPATPSPMEDLFAATAAPAGAGAPASSAPASSAAASSAPAVAAQSNALPLPAATSQSKRAGGLINPSYQALQVQQTPLALPVAPFWLFGLLGLAVLSAGGAFYVRSRAENAWRRNNALGPARLSTRDLLLIGAGLLLVLLLAAGIYWISTTVFTLPFPQP